MISLTSKEGYQMSGKYMAYVGSYSYSGTAKGITVYDVDVENGRFIYRCEMEVNNSSYLTVSHDRKTLYSIADEGVVSFRILENGSITRLNSANIKGMRGCHISTDEADELIQFLNEKLGSDKVKFYTGVSYRHLLVIKGGDKRLDCTPPHDVPLHLFRPLMVKPEVPEAQETADLLNDLILISQEILKDHPVNCKRMAAGKDPANSIWPWSPGYRPAMQTMQEMYGFNKGAVISAVDLIRGIGVYAGLEVISVEGATGLYDTNYEGKAHAALEALKTNDFVYLHVEASDEAGHEGDVDLKIKTIEYLDKRVIRIIYKELQTWDEPVAIAVLPDHPTPCSIRTHTNTPVPFLIYKPGQEPDAVTCFDEFSVLNGKYGVLEKDEFIKELL